MYTHTYTELPEHELFWKCPASWSSNWSAPMGLSEFLSTERKKIPWESNNVLHLSITFCIKIQLHVVTCYINSFTHINKIIDLCYKDNDVILAESRYQLNCHIISFWPIRSNISKILSLQYDENSMLRQWPGMGCSWRW